MPLTFTAVDGLAFAAGRGRLARAQSKTFVADDIGPLLELWHLSLDGLLPSIQTILSAASAEASELCLALARTNRYWICPSSKRVGFFRTGNNEDYVSDMYHLGVAAQKAAVDVGFTKQVANQLVAAIGEMVDNVYVHSKSSETGLAAFHARSGYFGFVVLDRGVGILRSLQESSEFARLADHGDALQLALTDGCSKFGPDSNRGHGFRPLFTGLSNLNGSLRFRSGDHALTIDGTNALSIPWAKIAKPNISGFFGSILCRAA